MIEDKIKLRISNYIARILYNDCSAFNFIRNTDYINVNLYLNKLIPNLVKLRKNRREQIHNSMAEALEYNADLKLQERLIIYMDTLFDKIYFADEELETLSEEIWIRPNKEKIKVFDEIIESELDICQMDLSKYLRSILNEYAKLPQHKRELILFDEEMDIIRQSFETDKIVNLEYEGTKYSLVMINFYSEFLYDQSNYIICYDVKRNKLKSLNLYKLKNVYLLSKKQELTDNVYVTYRKVCENNEFSKSDTFDIMEVENER